MITKIAIYNYEMKYAIQILLFMIIQQNIKKLQKKMVYVCVERE